MNSGISADRNVSCKEKVEITLLHAWLSILKWQANTNHAKVCRLMASLARNSTKPTHFTVNHSWNFQD